MVGIIVILGVSWLLLYYLEKENLNVLGFYPLKKIGQFIIGIGFIFALKLIFIYFDTNVNSITWIRNSNFNYSSLFHSFWYHFKSALTEDLIFRGALLYILIKRIGMQTALIISSIAFGIYHWVSYGIIGSGNIILLIYVLVTTGFIGYIWGFTFVKTKSIMMPLGFHLGWNFLNTFFYTSQPYGNLIFIESAKIELLEPYTSYYTIFTGLTPPLLTLIFVKLLIKTKVIA